MAVGALLLPTAVGRRDVCSTQTRAHVFLRVTTSTKLRCARSTQSNGVTVIRRTSRLFRGTHVPVPALTPPLARGPAPPLLVRHKVPSTDLKLDMPIACNHTRQPQSHQITYVPCLPRIAVSGSAYQTGFALAAACARLLVCTHRAAAMARRAAGRGAAGSGVGPRCMDGALARGTAPWPQAVRRAPCTPRCPRCLSPWPREP